MTASKERCTLLPDNSGSNGLALTIYFFKDFLDRTKTANYCVGQLLHVSSVYNNKRAGQNKTLSSLLNTFPNLIGRMIFLSIVRTNKSVCNLLRLCVGTLQALCITFCNLKGKTIPVTGCGGPYGCETSRLPHFL
jgi:hypothetical protein